MWDGGKGGGGVWVWVCGEGGGEGEGGRGGKEGRRVGGWVEGWGGGREEGAGNLGATAPPVPTTTTTTTTSTNVCWYLGPQLFYSRASMLRSFGCGAFAMHSFELRASSWSHSPC